MLTQERLKEILYYDSDMGIFTWLVSNSPRVNIGDVAGFLSDDGYSKIGIFGKQYRSHRLMWLYVYGSFPPTSLDHIDGDKLNNRVSNLRLCGHAENSRNVGIFKSNTSGFKGVSFNKQTNKWVAQATLNNMLHYLGLFYTPEEASEAYQKFAREHHGEFYRDTTNE